MMKTRLKKELQEFLLQDSISIETNIVSALIWEMINIARIPKLEQHNVSVGIDFSDYEFQEITENIVFELPSLTINELIQCLDFFNIPQDTYMTYDGLVLDNDFVFTTLLPQFKNYYQSFKEREPNIIKQYKAQSRRLLETLAISMLEYHTEKAVFLLFYNNPETSAQLAKMLISIQSLVTDLSNLKRQPILFKSIIAMHEPIKNYLSFPELSENEALSQTLQQISDALGLFTLYHRNESVLANQAFKAELEPFLNKHGLHSECHILEDLLLQCAGATVDSKGEKEFNSHYSSLIFTFQGMNQDNADLLVKFFTEMGDETATQGRRSFYGIGNPEGADRTCHNATDDSYYIEVDGKLFYEVIFPLIKEHINRLVQIDSDSLEGYKEASKPYLYGKNAKTGHNTGDNKASFFHKDALSEDTVSEEEVYFADNIAW